MFLRRVPERLAAAWMAARAALMPASEGDVAAAAAGSHQPVLGARDTDVAVPLVIQGLFVSIFKSLYTCPLIMVI